MYETLYTKVYDFEFNLAEFNLAFLTLTVK